MTRAIAEATRQTAIERAGGRCEYCLIRRDLGGFPHQIDHIISRKHGGTSLAYACVLCNRHKGSDISGIDSSGQMVRLFNPRRDQWHEHFQVDGATIEPLTPIGEATTRLLRVNSVERVVERRLLQDLGSKRVIAYTALFAVPSLLHSLTI